MFWRACRLLTIAALAVQPGARINTDDDLSVTRKPEFPVKPHPYAKVGGTNVVVIRREGDAYHIYNRATKLQTYARLYKIPEFPDYVMQYYDRKKRPIVYLFLKPTEKGFEIQDIEKLVDNLPP